MTLTKRQAHQSLQDLANGADPSEIYHEDALHFASHPWNETQGLPAIRAFWEALRSSFPDMERRDLIFLKGTSKEDDRTDPPLTNRPMVASLGHIQATFTKDFMGIPATHGTIMLRLSEAHHFEGDKIARSYVMIDLLDLMDQAGIYPLPAMLGAKGIWPGPSKSNVLKLDQEDPDTGETAFQTVMKMHQALLSFDGKNLDSMDHGAYWSAHFNYYAGAGIGAMRGLSGFRAHHQIPFLRAFPDRRGSGHYVRLGDGDFAVTGGWPSVQATHTGEWLGMSPTARQIDMRVMDFYHVQNGKICENWLPIDIPHMALQMGVDLFQKIKHQRGQPDLFL